MEKTYAIIQDGKVINVVVWDGQSRWSDSDNAIEITDNAGIGWDYANGKFTDNRPEPVQVDE
jgi:hypothetical protein